MEGGYIFPQFDLKYCDRKTWTYKGDLDALSGYMHSITSTNETIILPLTSVVFDPCTSLFNGPNANLTIVDPRNYTLVIE